MEAASPGALAGDKAQRIVEAMRDSVARYGTARSTFDRVARSAGVSRGLLHYYFGTKEKLLVEVVRHDALMRMVALEAQLEGVRDAEDFLRVLVANLEDLVENEPDLVTLSFELFTLARRNDEIAAEYALLVRRMREHLSGVLAAKQAEGVLKLRQEPEAIADILFALGDGISLRMLAESNRDFAATIRAGADCARALLINGH